MAARGAPRPADARADSCYAAPAVNKLSSIIGGAAVIAISFVFIVTFRPQSGAKTTDTGPACLAEVHGTCIPAHWYRAAFKMLAQRLPDGAAVKQLHLRLEAAEGLIEMQVLNDDAKRLGVTVSSEDVSREFVAGRIHVSLPAKDIREFAPRLGIEPQYLFQYMGVRGKTKKFDEKLFEKNARQATGLSSVDFREWQTKELIAARMREIIRARVHVGDEEVYDQYAREKSTATIDYVKFDYPWYATMVDVSPKTIEDWAAKNAEKVASVWDQRKNEFLPECRVTRAIEAKAEQMTATDEQKAAAKKKLEGALDRLKKGDDFAAVARDVSENTITAKIGGDVGCLSKAHVPKPLEDALEALQPGKFTDVIESEHAYYILKLEQVAQGADAERVGKAQVARDLYLSSETGAMAADGARRVMTAAKSGTPLKDAADAYVKDFLASHRPVADKKDDKKKDKADKGDAGDDKKEEAAAPNPDDPENSPIRPQIDTSLPFSEGGTPVPGIQGLNDVAKIAFGLKTVGELPADVIAYDGGFLVIQLKEKAAASRDEYAKNRQYYAQSMAAFKQQDALVSYMRRISSNLGPEARPLASLISNGKPAGSAAPSGSPAEEPPMEGPGDDDGE